MNCDDGRDHLAWRTVVVCALVLFAADLGGQQASPRLPREMKIIHTDLITSPLHWIGDSGAVFLNAMERQLKVVAVGDSKSRFLGRPGEGPGEYRSVAGLWVRGDTVGFVDGSLSRASVYDVRRAKLITHWPIRPEIQWRGRSIRPFLSVTPDCWLGLVYGGERDVIVLVRRHDGGRDLVDSVSARANRGKYIIAKGASPFTRVENPTVIEPQFALSPNGKAFAIVSASEDDRRRVEVRFFPDACSPIHRSRTIVVEPQYLSRPELLARYRDELSDVATRQKVALDALVEGALAQTPSIRGRVQGRPIHDALLDDRGRVWLALDQARHDRPATSLVRWLRIESATGLTDTMHVPADVHLEGVKDNRALGLRFGDDGGTLLGLWW